MKFKVLLTGMIFVMLLSNLVVAEDYTNTKGPSEVARIQLQVVAPQIPIVYDVPFNLDLLMHTGTTDIIEYDLTIKPSKTVTFGSSAPQFYGAIAGTPAKSGAIEGSNYRVKASAQALTQRFSSATLSPLVTLKGLIVKGKDTGQFTVDIVDSSKKVVALGAHAGSTDIQILEALTVIPALSTCSDAVVGYIDTNNNGEFDRTTETPEKEEACITGTGCAADCSFIQLGYKVKAGKSCAFGSYNCELEALNAQELLLKKLTALVNGVCLNGGFADAYNCNADKTAKIALNAQGKLTSLQKVQMVKEMAIALREFFTVVVGTSAQS